MLKIIWWMLVQGSVSQHFIMVEMFCANQSEANFMCVLLKSCQNVSEGNQSIHSYNGKMK